MTRKKIPSIAAQVKQGAASLGAWGRGETRLRTTFATREGERATASMTRAEMDAKIAADQAAKLERAQALKKIRADLALSQPKFAGLLHAGSAAVKQWEAARRAIPDTVFALAEIVRDFPDVREHLAASAATPVRRIAAAPSTHVIRSQRTKKRAHA